MLTWEGRRIKLLRAWRFYGFDEKQVAGCEKQLAQHNASSLRTISAVIAAMMVCFAAFPLFIEQKPNKAIAYFVVAALEFGVFLYARQIMKQKDPPKTQVITGFLIYYVALMVFGIYIGVVEARDGNAINFMIYMVCAQLMFTFSALQNLLMNLLAYAGFAWAAIALKPAHIWTTDLANALVALLCSLAFSWYISHVLVKQMLLSQEMERERNLFRRQSETDQLTGLNNRRYFFQTAPFYIDAWLHAEKNLCMLMIDLDYFKDYNDHYGHPMGDKVLVAVGRVLQQYRAAERVLCARVGGEEFSVFFAENDMERAEAFAKRLGDSIYNLKIPHVKSDVAPYITASFGMYYFSGEQITVDELYRSADLALYKAKGSGRNCVTLLDSETGEYEKICVNGLEQLQPVAR